MRAGRVLIGIATALCYMPQSYSAIDLTALPGLSVTASSEFTGSGPANGPAVNVIDDNIATIWNSGAFGGWVQVDFGQVFQFERIDLLGGFNGSHGDNTYQLLVSTDAVGWTTIASGAYHDEPLLTRGDPKWGSIHAFAATSEPIGRYLRYERTGGADWGYLVELEATGQLPAIPEPGKWLMVLFGLGLVGIVATHRRNAVVART